MPDEAGGELDAARREEKLPAHATQLQLLVEPDETVAVMPLPAPHPRLVDERQPSAVECDQLRAAAEVGRLDRWDGLGDRARFVVDDAGRVAEVDELQGVAGDTRHPV